MLEGIDVSDYQGQIDCEAVRDAGKAFVIVKVTEGERHVQQRFAATWAGAWSAGLMRGAYHFMRSGSGRLQAEHFLRHYPGAGEIAPALDLEEHEPTHTVPDPVEAIIWLAIVERETGVRPMVYTSPSFAATHRFAEHPALGACDLWIAHWHPEHGPPLVAPRVPRPWPEWRFWQTGKGHCAGIRGEVDLDVMHVAIS